MAPNARDALGGRVSLTMDNIARHNNKQDCWLVINKKVYDATEFVNKHPGGDILVSWAGADATSAFSLFHTRATEKMLPSLYVGDVVDAKISPVIEDYLQLRDELEAEGMFESSALYYAWKCISTTMILFASLYVLSLYGTSVAGTIAGSFLMALFWQQCGWLSHDYIHHQVFRDRAWGNYFGVFLGDFYQGFSVRWWKAKHNLHHAVPNVLHGVRKGDPDIDTMPFLAWASEFIEHGEANLPPAMLKYQAIYFLPLLCIARMSWVIQSIVVAVTMPKTDPLYTAELVGLTGHWAYYLAAGYFWCPGTNFWLYMFATQAFGGLLLGVIFTLGHNAMDIMKADSVNTTDFVSMQVRTTRNITSSWFIDWVTGGLNYQVEHHLFTGIPRHNLKKIQPRVMALCAKHNIPYTCSSFAEGSRDVLRYLNVIGEKAASVEAAHKSK